MSDWQMWNNWTDGERMLQWIGQKERADKLAKELRETDEALGDYTVNIIRSLPEAAAKLRAEVDRLTILLHTAADLLSTNRAMALEYIERTAVEEGRLPAPTAATLTK